MQKASMCSNIDTTMSNQENINTRSVEGTRTATKRSATFKLTPLSVCHNVNTEKHKGKNYSGKEATYFLKLRRWRKAN